MSSSEATRRIVDGLILECLANAEEERKRGIAAWCDPRVTKCDRQVLLRVHMRYSPSLGIDPRCAERSLRRLLAFGYVQPWQVDELEGL